MSLAETLVAGALLVLVGALVVFLLRPGYRAWMKGGRKSDVQQNCLIVIGRITQEFQCANASSVVASAVNDVDPDGQATRHDSISFLSNADDSGRPVLSPDGDPVWQRKLLFYHDGDAQQLRFTQAAVDPPSTEPPTLPDPPQRSDDRIVARHVRWFELDYTSAPMLKIVVKTHFEEYTSIYRSSIIPMMAAFIPPTPTPAPSTAPSASP